MRLEKINARSKIRGREEEQAGAGFIIIDSFN